MFNNELCASGIYCNVCKSKCVLYMQVCLSLLGTWHGTDASQKWDPQNSSLFQILLSIQGMILISDPYFNEPNVERMRGQAEGTKASNSYNAEIHLNNIRSAPGCSFDINTRLTSGCKTLCSCDAAQSAHPLHWVDFRLVPQ